METRRRSGGGGAELLTAFAEAGAGQVLICGGTFLISLRH
jgi:hypothetical protein